MVRFICALGVCLVFYSIYADASATIVSRASVSGAHLDANLLTGGGTDDTSILQRLLNAAAGGKSVHLILDGPALVAGLNVYGNTTIECTAGGGLYLKDGATRAILRNAHRSRGTILDEHIEVRDCFFNGNRKNQLTPDVVRPDFPSGPPVPSNKEKDGTYISGLQFLGVNDLKIMGVTLWNIRAFGALIGNAQQVEIRGVTIDHGGGPNADVSEYATTDGLHFKGPLQYISIDSIKVRVGDDSLAFNANDYETDDITARNDFGPYVGQGPITDVTISNVHLMGSLDGIRLLSTNERIDRISIENVTGVVRLHLLNISHFVNPTSTGNVGAITVDNAQVDRPTSPAVSSEDMARAKKDRVMFAEFNGGNVPLIGINARMDSLRLHNISTRVSDRRPLLRIGPDAIIGNMHVDLTAIDPSRIGSILELEEGGHVESLKFCLDWLGYEDGQSRDPITSRGGTISSLEWVGTPPLFIEARSSPSEPRSVSTMFSQQLVSKSLRDGVTILVNDKEATILRGDLEDNGKSIRYGLASPLKPSDRVVWSYNASYGDLKNQSGLYLRSVSAKKVRFE
jgi:hypothetical protein